MDGRNLVSVRSEEERLHARQGDVPAGRPSEPGQRSQRVSSVNETDAVSEFFFFVFFLKPPRRSKYYVVFLSQSQGAEEAGQSTGRTWLRLQQLVHAHCVIAGILNKTCRTQFRHLNPFVFTWLRKKTNRFLMYFVQLYENVYINIYICKWTGYLRTGTWSLEKGFYLLYSWHVALFQEKEQILSALYIYDSWGQPALW